MVLESVREVVVEAKTDHPREAQTRDELRRLLAEHDLSGLQWTDRVVIENWAVPHSHPILTLNTRTRGDDLLAAYLHEQLHWWFDAHPHTRDAVDATRPAWPTVADASAGGAKSEHSTREHLLLCYLEHQSMLELVGPDRASAALHRKTQDVVYPWVYFQVRACGPALDTICTDHKLRPARLATI
jgi:hypothetical protein